MDFLWRISFDLSLSLSFFLLPFSVISSFVARFFVFLSHGIVAGQLFRKGTNIIVKEEWVNSEISSGFLLKMLPVFVSVTLLTLVRISKTRYRWKDLSLLTLLLTNLLTYTESLMDPGRKICIVPHGTKTTNTVVEGQTFLQCIKHF